MPLDWMSDIAALRSIPPSKASPLIREIVVRAGGKPFGLREARSRLFLTIVAVSRGSPKLLDIDESTVLLIAVDDLAEIVCGGTFDEFKEEAEKAGKKVGRRLVRDR